MKVIENNKSAMVGIQAIGEHSIAKGSEGAYYKSCSRQVVSEPLKSRYLRNYMQCHR